MKHPHACRGAAHHLSRRQVLGGFLGAAGAASLGGLLHPATAGQLAEKDKQVLFVWLDGGLSQLESWDPKPGTQFGGPFRAIPTAVPGLHISELLPEMAKRADRLAIIRNLHTRFEDHSRAVDPIQRGDPKERGVDYPFFGGAIARLLGSGASGMPPYLHVKPGSGGFQYKDGGFLGARYGALALGDGKPPALLNRPEGLAEDVAQARDQLRRRADARFRQQRRSELPEAYAASYDLAQQLMRHAELFAPHRLTQEDLARYGDIEFGRHMLLARHLLEAGTRFVKVTMYYWDTHGDNFNCHLDLVTQLDLALSAMLDDLSDRGMLDHVLVIVLSEFGRTPRVNARVGRDHWPEAWSTCIAGCGIRGGTVVGRTNDKGTWVEGDAYDIGHLFHTYFRALGIDPHTTAYDNGGQPLPIAHDDCHAIEDVLL